MRIIGATTPTKIFAWRRRRITTKMASQLCGVGGRPSLYIASEIRIHNENCAKPIFAYYIGNWTEVYSSSESRLRDQTNKKAAYCCGLRYIIFSIGFVNIQWDCRRTMYTSSLPTVPVPVFNSLPTLYRVCDEILVPAVRRHDQRKQTAHKNYGSNYFFSYFSAKRTVKEIVF